MARIAGRSTGVAWVAGIACAIVIGMLVVLSVPLVPGAVQWVGDALRGPTSAPAADGVGPSDPGAPGGTSACRALYTEGLWSELTARAGGEPVQDESAPTVSAPSVVTALSPAVRVTCSWTAVTTGSIVTTIADVAAGTAPIADAALSAQGFACDAVAGGVSCSKQDGGMTEQVAVRDGVWVSSRLDGWHPNFYAERVADQVW